MTGVTSWKQWKNSKKIIFVFPIHRPSAGTPAPNLYLTAVPPIYIYQPWYQICIYQSWPQIFNYQPWSVRSLGLHIPTLFPPPPICIYWPCPTIFITVLWIYIYLLIYSSSSGSSNISNCHFSYTGNWELVKSIVGTKLRRSHFCLHSQAGNSL